MRAAVLFERSGLIRDALRSKGIAAISVDYEPTDRPGPHIQADCYPIKQWIGYDLIIAHPVCRYLANSGVRWLDHDPDRQKMVSLNASYFRECLNAPAPFVAVENSIHHGYASKLVGRKHDFTTQPWQFGDNYTKTSCWWIKNLPVLNPTSKLDGSTAYAKCHREPPSFERERKRAETEPGIAAAIATQWGMFVATEVAVQRFFAKNVNSTQGGK